MSHLENEHGEPHFWDSFGQQMIDKIKKSVNGNILRAVLLSFK